VNAIRRQAWDIFAGKAILECLYIQGGAVKTYNKNWNFSETDEYLFIRHFPRLLTRFFNNSLTNIMKFC